MINIDYRQAAFNYERTNKDAAPSAAFIAGVVYALNHCDIVIEDNSELGFDNAWNLYQKKVGPKEKLRKKWNKLPVKERAAAILYIPAYVRSTPDKKYRKNFETFLNQKSWNDEIINHDEQGTFNYKSKTANILFTQ